MFVNALVERARPAGGAELRNGSNLSPGGSLCV